MTSFHRNIAATFGLVACTALGSASAQTVVNGPYYAMPAWDQTLPASTRFLVLSNLNGEAVLDRETGLVWERKLSDGRTYESNYNACIQAKTGGRFGWRLPTAPELGTLFDPAVAASPGLPVGHPFLSFPGGNVALSTSTFFTNGNNAALFYGPLPDGRNSVGIGALGLTGEARALCVRGGGPTVR